MPAVDTSKLSILSRLPRTKSHDPFNREDALTLIQHHSPYDLQSAVKIALEKQWYIAIAFLVGQQFLVWDDATGRLREPRQPNSRMNVVANKIFSYLHRSMAIMTSTGIPWKVAPASTDREDIDAARVAENVLDHDKQALEIDDKRIEAEYWAQSCGTVFWKPVWDPDAGEKDRIYKNPDTGEAIPPEIIEANPDMKRDLDQKGSYWGLAPGDVVLEIVNPFRISVDPMASRYRDLRWIKERTWKPLSYFYQRYGNEAKGINTVSSDSKLNSYERRLLSLNGFYNTTGPVEPSSDEATAEEIELFMAPYTAESEGGELIEYPYGRHIIAAGDKVLMDGENEYLKMGFPDHGFPYEPQFYSRVPGRFWGSSHVEHLIPQQRLYNYVRSKIAEGFRMMGSKKWLVPRDANLSARALTSGIEAIEWDSNNTGGHAPVQISPAAPSPEYMEIQASCDRDMQEISGQPEAVQGQAPGSIRSGVALRSLQEKGLLVSSTMIRSREIMFGKIGKKILILEGENRTEEKLVKVFGRDRAYQVMKFKGADLRGNYDVMVPTGSMRPEGKAETAEFAFAAMERGAFDMNNPSDKEAMLRLLRFSEDEEFFRQREGDRYVANKENDAMSDPNSPVFPDVNEFDDDVIHLEVLNRMRKSDVYFNLPDKQKAGIDWHGRQHEKRLAQRQAAQLQMIEATKGAPGQKGQAPKAAPTQQELGG